MPVSLLSTKLYIPPLRENAIPRPRLTEKLMAGIGQPGKLTLLSGPPGFGKTTLLSEFVDRLQLPVAWVSLDEGDNDPARFWSYLIAACQTVQADVGASAQAVLQSPQPFPAGTVPTILINDLASLDRELVLVLDDYHAIQNESVHTALVFLLEHLPHNLHLVVSTRNDPPWPLARFRARNQLVEIRAQDLRFSVAEAAEFLNHTMGIPLAAEEVAALEARTEGWIAGLQLAALSMQGSSDTASFVRAFTGSHVYVAEYLLEEVLQRQPEEVQAFLLQTSILERLSAKLCEAILGDQGIGDRDFQAEHSSPIPSPLSPASPPVPYSDCQSILQHLDRANLFLVPLDDQGQWYRYHHLFGDLLQMRLSQTAPADAIAALHSRAATWYEQHDFIAEAVNHRLAARDFDAAAQLIESHANPMVTRGELVTLMQWTEALPAGVVWQRPQIIIAKVWALALSGAVRQAEPLLQQAEAQFEADRQNPALHELAGFAAAIRAFFAMMAGEDSRALELAERAEALLPESSVHARWLLPYTLGAVYRSRGQYQKAAEAFAQQARMGEEYGSLVVWGTGVTGVALVRRAQGRLQEAGNTCRQALQRLSERRAAQYGSLAKLETPLVEVLVEQNALEEARRRLAGVMKRMRGWPMPTDQLHAQLALIELQDAQGDLPEAYETLRAAKELIAAQPVLANLRRSVELWEIRLALQSGDLASAARLLDALQPGSGSWVELRDQELLLLARLRLAQGKPDAAERILSPLASETEAGERKGALIATLALRACVFDAQGEGRAALEVLIKALGLAEPEGFVRVFVDLGGAMQGLLAAVLRKIEPASGPDSRPSKAYVTMLLDAFPEAAGETSTSIQAAGLVEPLTARETEVLQRIAAGDSNRDIAEKLVITVSAVKKHTANIYGKLSVNSRTQAVARARQLGLLPADR